MSSWHRIKRDPADIAFSRYVRLRKKHCERCGRVGRGAEGIQGLECSHFHSRRKESVRFDINNIDVLCVGCHRWFHENKDEYRAWKLKKLGQREFDLLAIRASKTVKRDREMSLIMVQELLKELAA